MKNFCTCVIALGLCLFCAPAALAAGPYSSGYFYYDVKDSGVVINGYFGTDSEVHLPEEIAGKPVSEIDEGAFAGTAAREIWLPESVMEVSEGALDENQQMIRAEPEEEEPEETTPTPESKKATATPTPTPAKAASSASSETKTTTAASSEGSTAASAGAMTDREAELPRTSYAEASAETEENAVSAQPAQKNTTEAAGTGAAGAETTGTLGNADEQPSSETDEPRGRKSTTLYVTAILSAVGLAAVAVLLWRNRKKR